MNNLLNLSQDQLWEALKTTDKLIKEAEEQRRSPLFIPDLEDAGDVYQSQLELRWHIEELENERTDIINTFVEVYGYNPDNLCVSTKQ
jgi:hypothetical protein